MSKIELKHIDKYYGKNHILKDVNLTIEDGDFMTLLGPSGCGKTTTLRVVSGLEKPQNGTILMNDLHLLKFRVVKMYFVRALTLAGAAADAAVVIADDLILRI